MAAAAAAAIMMIMLIMIIIIIIIDRPKKYTDLKDEITNMATECSLCSTISLTHMVYYTPFQKKKKLYDGLKLLNLLHGLHTFMQKGAYLIRAI